MGSIMHWLELSIAICICVHSIRLVGCQKTDKTITLDLKSAHNGKLFHTTMEIGHKGNKRTFNMLIATSYQLTWLASTELSPARGYSNRSADEYEPNGHHTAATGAVYGGRLFHLHYDTFQVGSQSIQRQPFALMYHGGTKRTMVPEVEGIIGLNEGVSWPANVDYLFANLYKQNYIDSLSYSLYINETAVANRLNGRHEDQPEGALVLGGIDAKYYTGDLVYVPMFHYKDRLSLSNVSLNISNIRLDWTRLNRAELTDSLARLGTFQVLENRPTSLKLDSSLIVFFGDRRTLDLIHLRIIGASPILRGNFYVFKDCRLDNKPDVVFSVVHGFEIRVTPEEYVIEHELNERRLCLSAFKPYNEDVWSFGTAFLRKYYTVFDYQNNRVGFATPT